MKTVAPLKLIGMLALTTVMATGCRFDGANSLPLPGNSVGSGAYTVTIELRDVQNLVGNSIVKADNVTIGTVTTIAVKNSIAVVTADIDDQVELPRNVTAQLAQTSVLGAQYLELTSPTGPGGEGEKLQDGDSIALTSSSQYPATEQVLAALSLVLNGSGLQQVRTIMTELNDAVGGNEDAVNRSFGRIETFVSGLDQQREDIVRAIDSLDQFSYELALQKDTLGSGIEAIQPALAVLDEQKTQLVTMLDSVGNLGDRAAEVLSSSQEDLTANLHNLGPVLTQLAAAGEDLPESLLVGLTYPFPVTAVEKGFRGDYANLFLTLDLSAEAIQTKVVGSFPVKDLVPMSNRAVNPLIAPTEPSAPTGTDNTNGGR